MSRLQLFLACVCLAVFSGAALADAPWQVRNVTKQDEAARLLRVTLDVSGTAVNWSTFKVVNEQGEQIATPAGYNAKNSTIDFEGDWSVLMGRYLENGNQRIPLFQTDSPEDVAPAEVVRSVEPVHVETPRVHDVAYTPRTYDVHHTPVVHDRVIHHDDRHVYHHDRDVHHHGGTTHHHHDGVHHTGGGTHHHGDAHNHSGGGSCGCGTEGCSGCGGDKGGDGNGSGTSPGGGCASCGDCGCSGDGCADCGKKANPWAIDPLGKALGQGGQLAMGDAPGSGPGAGPGSGPGTGPGTGPGDGTGPGEGCADGCDEGPGPEEGPDPAEKAPGDAPGPGPGDNPGPGNMSMNNMRNLAPQYKQRVRNLAPKLKMPKVPTIYGPDILTYNPEIPYWNPNIPQYQPGYGYGGGGGGYGGGGSGAYGTTSLEGVEFGVQDYAPDMVLYISVGDDKSPGRVYQVDDQGRVLGMVNLPSTATGIAMHREHGLICTTPRDGGKIYKVDDGGAVETVLENDDKLIHPVDVAVAPNSDSIILADNMADTIMMTNASGRPADTFKKFEGMKFQNQRMSVAVGRDRAVIYGSDGNKGIYRFSGDQAEHRSTPILPEAGGVAADPVSDHWAATQGDNEIVVMEGETKKAEYKLPAGKILHNGGLLSFAPPAGAGEKVGGTGIVTVMRDAADANAAPYLMEFKTSAEGEVDRRLLFEWTKEPIQDFVVGPRMLWEKNHRNTYKGVH